MKNIHRLALSGMRGRKKDTLVLVLVIIMSFLFLSVGTILLSSLTESQYRQRMGLYGSWKLCDSQKNPDLTKQLQKAPWASASHQVELLGIDRNCGSVSVWNDDFARMGGLRLLEGRAPTAPGEIVLEKGQLSLFPEPIRVGSQITLFLSYAGTPQPEKLCPDYPDAMELFGITVDARPFQKALAQDVTPVRLENAIRDFVQMFDKIVAEYQEWGITIPEMPMELPESVYQMSREELQQFLDVLAGEPIFLYTMAGASRAPISIRNFRTVLHPSGDLGSVHWSQDNTFSFMTSNSTVPQDIMLQYGGLQDQTLNLERTCTVVGILETTADRWDVTDVTVPNSYISAATRKELQDTVTALSRAERPEQFSCDPETVLTTEQYSLYETDDSMASCYKNLKNLKGNILKEENSEVMYHEKVPVPDLAMTEVQMMEEAQKALGDQAFTQEELQTAAIINPKLYLVAFAPDALDAQSELSAYVLNQQFRILREDGASVPFPASFGYLIYETETGWKTEKVPMDTLRGTDFAPEGFRSLGLIPGSLADAYAFNTQAVGINRYAYPSEKGLSAAMGGTLIAVIVMITVCAVFQIFFTQLRRRTRKLTLLRSIGATNGQIFALLGTEGLYMTLAGLLIGDGLGFGIACLILTGLSDTVFHLDLLLFLAGQAGGILAVAAGLLIPSLRSLHAPLTGRMSVKRRKHVKIRPMKRQSFRRLCVRDLKTNPGRTIGTAVLCVFLITMELICVFLGNSAFHTYRETVVNADKPDFILTMNHAGSNRKTGPMLDTLHENPSLDRVDFYRKGEGLFLWYEAMDESPVVKAHKAIKSPYIAATRSKDPGCKTDPGLLTEFYSVASDSPLFAQLNAALTEGRLDPVAYENGSQVLVILPMLAPGQGGGEPKGDSPAQMLASSGTLQMSLSSSVRSIWQEDTTLAPGTPLTLGTDNYQLREVNAGYRQKLLDTMVGGVIRYFPGRGIWPFAGDVQSHVIIGSPKAMARLYDSGFTTYGPEEMDTLDFRREYFMPTEYGAGVWSIYAKEGAANEETISPLSRYARQEHLTLRNLMDSKRAVYEKALSSAILAGTLALAATVIVWMILYNTLNSAQEQSRRRTGILSALGVTQQQLYRAQLLEGFAYWLVSVVVSNLLLLLVVLISGILQQSGQSIGFAGILQIAAAQGFTGYPWRLHLVLCLLELPILLLFHFHAARIPTRYSPIENIRS